MFKVMNKSIFNEWVEKFENLEDAIKYADLMSYVSLWGVIVVDENNNKILEY